MNKSLILLVITIFVSSFLFAQKKNKELLKEIPQGEYKIRIYKHPDNTFSYSISKNDKLILSDESQYGSECSCKFKTEIATEKKALLSLKDISEKGVMPSSVGNKIN